MKRDTILYLIACLLIAINFILVNKRFDRLDRDIIFSLEQDLHLNKMDSLILSKIQIKKQNVSK